MQKGMVHVEDSTDSFIVSVPSRKDFFSQFFMLFWLVGWFLGLITAMYGISPNPTLENNGIIGVWSILWIISGTLVIFLLLWSFFGRERIVLSGNIMKLEKTVFGIGSKKIFLKKDINNIRYQNPNISTSNLNIFAYIGFGLGKIRFESRFKTYSFATTIDDTEVNHIVKELNDRM